MKKHLKIFVVIVLMIVSLAAKSQNNEFTVPLSDPAKRGKLKAHLNSGSISVKGTARKDVVVRYSVMEQDEEDHDDEDHDEDNDNDNEDNHGNHKNNSRAGLKRIGGGGVDLEITENANFVKVESNTWNNPIKLEIEVPSGMDLVIHTYNDGDLMVSNVQGVLELTNFNGEITALNISGSAVANTYNGSIRVSFDKVTADTPMSFRTFNGDVDVTFPAAAKATVKMKTEQGELYSDFDLQLKTSGPVKKSETKGGVYKVVVDEWKTGDINGGGAEMTMQNYTGDIIIRKK